MIRIEVEAIGLRISIETGRGARDVAPNPEPPVIEAGGMGFQLERADIPTYRDDCPGVVRKT